MNIHSKAAPKLASLVEKMESKPVPMHGETCYPVNSFEVNLPSGTTYFALLSWSVCINRCLWESCPSPLAKSYCLTWHTFLGLLPSPTSESIWNLPYCLHVKISRNFLRTCTTYFDAWIHRLVLENAAICTLLETLTTQIESGNTRQLEALTWKLVPWMQLLKIGHCILDS